MEVLLPSAALSERPKHLGSRKNQPRLTSARCYRQLFSFQLFLLLGVGFVPVGAGVENLSGPSDLQERLSDPKSQSISILVAFVTPDGSSRQLNSNIKWAAEQFEQKNYQNVEVWRLVTQGSDREEIIEKYEIKELPAMIWISKGRSPRHFDGSQSANGILKWVKQTRGAEELGGGQSACDACRTSLEAMHINWSPLVNGLVENGAIESGPSPRMKDDEAGVQEMIETRLCTNPYVAQMSDSIKRDCSTIARWFGPEIISRHFGLFASWCGRSSDRGRQMAVKEIQDCAAQWTNKVPNGRLGLHEKIMGYCSIESGDPIKSCHFVGTEWKNKMREGTWNETGACEACLGIAEDILFVARRNKLGQIPEAALRKRRLDLVELLDQICVEAFNRHEGDATEGPARKFNSVCLDVMEEFNEEVIEGLLRLAGTGGIIRAAAEEISVFPRKLCFEQAKKCGDEEIAKGRKKKKKRSSKKKEL